MKHQTHLPAVAPAKAGSKRLASRSRTQHWLRRALAAVVTAGVVTVAAANLWVWAGSAGRVSVLGAAQDTRKAPVAIVLGAGVRPDGTPSPWLSYRLDVAVSLYQDQRVEAVVVSGDNREANYDEPSAMRAYLLRAGVPDQAIVRDYAGFDTRATCVRAKKVFGVDQALLVTQDFHLPRAVVLCRHAGVDAYGVADTRAHVNRGNWVRSWLRERLAVVKAAGEELWGRPPLLGPYETGVDQAVAWTRAQRS